MPVLDELRRQRGDRGEEKDMTLSEIFCLATAAFLPIILVITLITIILAIKGKDHNSISVVALYVAAVVMSILCFITISLDLAGY